MTESIKIVQHNVNRQRIASLQLKDFCIESSADIVLIQEPATCGDNVYGFESFKQIMCGDEAGAAIVILNSNIQVLALTNMSSQHITVVKLSRGKDSEAVTMVSAYFKYNMPTTYFIEKLHAVLEQEPRTIIGADVNGHSCLWHCPRANNRGLLVEELIEDFGLTVVNKPDHIPTYNREGMGSSNIDITLVTPRTQNLVTGWTVSDVTDSDHNVVHFNLRLRDEVARGPVTNRFDTRKADWDAFARSLWVLEPTIDGTTIDTYALTIVKAIQEAAKKAIPQLRRPGTRTSRQPWWTNELNVQRKDLARKRRAGLHRTNRVEYNTARNNYLHTIRAAKAAAWRDFAGQINCNPWGKAFSWAKRGSKPRPVPSSMVRQDGTRTSTVGETAELLLSTFFPSETELGDPRHGGPLEGNPGGVDLHRVKAAIWRMSPSKAPGADGISAAILRKAWPIIGEDITGMFEKCISEAVFPSAWRNAKLVVIPKPGKKDLSDPKTYRPISLLPTLGKALETLIIQDLERETGLNDFENQHGFVPGKSTITAIRRVYEWVNNTSCRFAFGVFLDITGAFDHVKWAPILNRLEEMGASNRTLSLIQSYLKSRKVNYDLEGASFQRTLERGCPQGSQLGPTLWKVAMTSIGSIKMDRTATIVMYADDIALLVGAARPQTAFSRVEIYLEELKAWAAKYGLKFSPSKSQLMTLKGGLKPLYSVRFGTNANDQVIRASENVKYLGVILDPRQSFWEHIVSLKEKNKTLYKRLRAMTSANWGMGRLAAMTIYKAVFLPRITYAAEIWEDACHMKKAIKALGSMQRDPMIAITSAYRTSSTNCLTAVAGALPLDLEIRAQASKLRLGKGLVSQEDHDAAVSDLIGEWQERYDSVEKGEWTKIMIPDLSRRYVLPMTLDHYTTQFLTGHGDFNGKLHQFKLVPRPNCACGSGSETVRHVLLHCRRNEDHRKRLIDAMRDEGEAWPPRNGAFLQTKRTYEALRKFSNDSLRNRSDR